MTDGPDILGPTGSGGFNVIWLQEGKFILQGHLTQEQLEQLHEVLTNHIMEVPQ